MNIVSTQKLHLNNIKTVQKNSGLPSGSAVNNLPVMQLTRVQSLCQEDPLEKEMAIHSSIPAWRIPMDRGAWQATVHGVARVGHDLAIKPPPPPLKLWLLE